MPLVSLFCRPLCPPSCSAKHYNSLFFYSNSLSLIHISEPTRPLYISYAVFCLKNWRKFLWNWTLHCRFALRQLSRRMGKHLSESVKMAKGNPLYTRQRIIHCWWVIESFLLFVSYCFCHTESLTVKSLWDYWGNKTKKNITMQTQFP